MRTDIHLQNAKRALVIDTKYYADALQERYGKRSMHSSNLYQIFAYLKNAEALGGSYQNAEGILLYPSVDYELDACASLQGHKVSVRTIKLDQSWKGIRRDLLAVIGVEASSL